MQNYRIKLLLLFQIFFYPEIFAQYGKINIDDYIQDAKVFQENQLPLLPTLVPFKDLDEAMTKPESESGYYQTLNGKWKFSLENTPYTFPADFYSKNFDDLKWNEIPVPSVWQKEGYDHLMYRNIPMEFNPYDPPLPSLELARTRRPGYSCSLLHKLPCS